MAAREIDLQKMVDQYFSNHSQKWQTNPKHSPFPINRPTPSPSFSKNRTKDRMLKEKYEINQNDVDVLQLMNPRLNASQYMSNIIGLHQKEENFRPREDKNEPMQLALSTRKLFPNALLHEAQSEAQLNRMSQSHANQLWCDISHQKHINRLREMCYLGLGRMIIERKETKKKVELTKANYHTRQYLLPHVQEEISRLEEEQEELNNKYYLITNANSRGINFQVEKMPEKLSKVLEFNKYREIVCTLNEIIQETVYNHKKKIVGQRKTSPAFIWLPFILVIVITLLLINQLKFSSTGLQITCLLVSMAMMIFILMLSCHRFHQKIVYVSLIDQINKNITEYLNYLNSRPYADLYWKTANHLYWIQIQHIPEPNTIQKVLQRQ